MISAALLPGWLALSGRARGLLAFICIHPNLRPDGFLREWPEGLAKDMGMKAAFLKKCLDALVKAGLVRVKGPEIIIEHLRKAESRPDPVFQHPEACAINNDKSAPAHAALAACPHAVKSGLSGAARMFSRENQARSCGSSFMAEKPVNEGMPHKQEAFPLIPLINESVSSPVSASHAAASCAPCPSLAACPHAVKCGTSGAARIFSRENQARSCESSFMPEKPVNEGMPQGQAGLPVINDEAGREMAAAFEMLAASQGAACPGDSCREREGILSPPPAPCAAEDGQAGKNADLIRTPAGSDPDFTGAECGSSGPASDSILINNINIKNNSSSSGQAQALSRENASGGPSSSSSSSPSSPSVETFRAFRDSGASMLPEEAASLPANWQPALFTPYARKGRAFTFLDRNGARQRIDAAMVEEWRKTYDMFNIENELSGIANWLATHPEDRPEPGHEMMERYIGNCLTRKLHRAPKTQKRRAKGERTHMNPLNARALIALALGNVGRKRAA